MNGSAVDVPPPGDGVNTVTCAVLAVARSAALIDARTCVPLTNVVGRGAPSQRTSEAAVNPLPLTVSVKGPPPAVARDGLIVETTGIGFMAADTVTAGLVATLVYPLSRNRRNSYVPGVDGMLTVQVRVVTPPPTYV